MYASISEQRFPPRRISGLQSDNRGQQFRGWLSLQNSAASAEFSNVEVSAFPENVGYFGGANAALQLYLENHEHPEWLVVCNNDIVFDDPHFLRHLLERTPGKAGVIAPAIISSLTGYDANPSIRR